MTTAISYKKTKVSCYAGLVVQAIINNFLPILFIVLQDNYGLDYEKLGRLIFINFITQLFIDALTPKIVGKLGYRKCAVISQGGAALGLLLLSLLPQIMSNTYLAIVFAIVIYAVSSGLMEVILSPLMEVLPTKNKSGNMSLLHSFYCWGQAFTIIGTTLLIYLFGYSGWVFIPIVWAIIPLANMISFLFVPIIEPVEGTKNSKFKNLIKSRRFKCFMVMMLCAGASEIAMAQWASMFAQKALGLSKVSGDFAGPCAFAIFMGTGRILYAKLSPKISFRKAVIFMSALCVVCYFIVAVSAIPFLSLVFCAICGFTVSLFWPGTYSAGAAAFPQAPAVMFSVFALCGDLGCSLGPWLLGASADVFGLNTGFAVSAVFPLLMLVVSLIFLKENDCKKE